MLKVLKEKVDNVQKQMGTWQRDGSSKTESKWNARNQKHGNRNEELTPLLNTEMGPGRKALSNYSPGLEEVLTFKKYWIF